MVAAAIAFIEAKGQRLMQLKRNKSKDTSESDTPDDEHDAGDTEMSGSDTYAKEDPDTQNQPNNAWKIMNKMGYKDRAANAGAFTRLKRQGCNRRLTRWNERIGGSTRR